MKIPQFSNEKYYMFSFPMMEATDIILARILSSIKFASAVEAVMSINQHNNPSSPYFSSISNSII